MNINILHKQDDKRSVL